MTHNYVDGQESIEYGPLIGGVCEMAEQLSAQVEGNDDDGLSLGADESPPQPAPLMPVADLGRGYTLYRQQNGAGGHTYWSDEIGGGVLVWDTCLVQVEHLMAAIKAEADRLAVESAAPAPSNSGSIT